MTVENFTTYTEVDPNAKITVEASRVTYAALHNDEDAYVYADKGVDYFSTNFELQLTLKITAMAGDSGYARGSILSLTNLVDDWQGIYTADGDILNIHVTKAGTTTYSLAAYEVNGGVLYTSSAYTATFNTIYYLTIVRDESVGTYGTLYLYIYSDAARTDLLATKSVALHTSKKDFRYLYAVQSADANVSTRDFSGYTENLEIISTVVFIPKVWIM